MFDGVGEHKVSAEICNMLMRKIISLRDKWFLENASAMMGEPNITIYVGYAEYYALRSINKYDSRAMKEETFMGAKVVRVCADRYAHAVLMS